MFNRPSLASHILQSQAKKGLVTMRTENCFRCAECYNYKTVTDNHTTCIASYSMCEGSPSKIAIQFYHVKYMGIKSDDIAFLGELVSFCTSSAPTGKGWGFDQYEINCLSPGANTVIKCPHYDIFTLLCKIKSPYSKVYIFGKMKSNPHLCQ